MKLVVASHCGRLCLGTLFSFFILLSTPAHADIRLLLEEPINFLGHLSSTGHSALLLDHICTDNYTRVRECQSGEHGSVVSRYQGVGGYDWLAIPSSAYFYATESLQDVPQSVSAGDAETLRQAYSARNFRDVLPTLDQGDLDQLVGASYRRRILVVRIHTTPAQDARLMLWLNASRNKSHFNFFLNNCADFTRKALNVVFPGAVKRSLVFDAGLTTPKQVASSLNRYSKRHRELGFEVSVLPQVPGNLPRSGRMYGVTESFLKTKYYLFPLAILQPAGIGSVIAVGLCDRRYSVQSEADDAQEIEGSDLYSDIDTKTAGSGDRF